jgi:hypothetical protein
LCNDSGEPGLERGRDRERDGRNGDGDRAEKAAAEEPLDAIKEQYLGSNKPKMRAINRPSDKSRFSFN